jgi:hypothetical protein
VLGCIAFKQLREQGFEDGLTAEVKRMYLRDSCRGGRVGQKMVRVMEDLAASPQYGYTTLKLDTLERLPAAIRVYSQRGFVRCGQYVHNPMPDCVFMSKSLKGRNPVERFIDDCVALEPCVTALMFLAALAVQNLG